MKILLGEPSDPIVEKLLGAIEASHHQIFRVKTGPECLSKIKEELPDLIVIDIMMPIMHGIELLKIIKQSWPDTPVIITSFQTMLQNFRAAMEAGADYFLAKPFDTDLFFEIATQLANHMRIPPPHPPEIHKKALTTPAYTPKTSPLPSYLKFWGTRGSNPVAGNEYARFGGNTCSLEIRYKDSLVILDAGTGIRPLGETLLSDSHDTFNLFIGHTHWDHISGFPFFSPMYQKNGNIIIWSPIGFEKTAKDLFTDMLNYAYFPVRLEEMRSKILFKELRDTRPVTIGDITIDTFHTNHPGPTLGFTIETPTQKIGYITDNEVLMGYLGDPKEIHSDHPLLEPHKGLIKFLEGCNTIIHEAQYFPDEYQTKIGWGHSSISNASILIRETKCAHWIVTHHDPTHTDEKLQTKLQLHLNILKECGINCTVDFAYDGYILPLE